VSGVTTKRLGAILSNKSEKGWETLQYMNKATYVRDTVHPAASSSHCQQHPHLIHSQNPHQTRHRASLLNFQSHS